VFHLRAEAGTPELRRQDPPSVRFFALHVSPAMSCRRTESLRSCSTEGDSRERRETSPVPPCPPPGPVCFGNPAISRLESAMSLRT
jgi:hypothetical protein